MIRTVHAEFIKLRTVAMHWVLAAIAVLFPVVVTTLVAIFVDADGDLQSDDLAVLIASVGVVSAMLLGAMSVVSVTAEHAHGTIRPTYAATPDRLRVTLAKLSTNSFVALVVAALTVMLSWVISSTILDSRDQPVAIGDDGVLATLVSMIALTVVVTWFALGLGLVIRNSPATVTLFLLWPLLIESLVGLVLTLVGWEGAPKWLPYGAGIGAAVGEGDGGTETLGRPNGLIYFGVVTLAIVALGAWSDNRRDA